MGKTRVYELAKELEVNTKDLIELLQKLGADVKNHMSVVEENLAKRISASVAAKRQERSKTAAAAKTKTPAAAPVAVPAAGQQVKTEPAVSVQTPAPAAKAAPAPAPKTAEAPAGQQPVRPAAQPRPQPQGGGDRPSPANAPARPMESGRQPAPGGPKPPMREKQPGFDRGRPVQPGPSGGRPAFAERPRGERGAFGERGSRPFRPRDERRPERGPRPEAGQGGRPFGGERQRPGAPYQGGPGRDRQRPAGGRGPAVIPPPPAEAAREAEQRRAPAKNRRDFERRDRAWNEEKEAAAKIEALRRGGKLPGKKEQKAANRSRGVAVGAPPKPPAPVKRGRLLLPPELTVKELAAKLAIDSGKLIKKLMDLGILATINQVVDSDVAQLVATELGFEPEVEVPKDVEAMYLGDTEDPPETLQPRWPVVTIMGHVDHGKTSLLDAIRETRVTAEEAGGITQHIGAYQVDLKGKKITFLDTPGHEAFTAMRARGAQVTDIAVLVVAADDGVMPQTVEAINHAKAANVPIIVAINKMDKPNANPDRVKQELTEYGLVPEEWGGDVICAPVSALRKEGLDNLLEMILLVAEMRELKANPNRSARGVVVEAELDKGRGPVATVLIQKGTLNIGDSVVAGNVAGRVRAMFNDKGKRVKKAGPAMPVAVLGLEDCPKAGDVFVVSTDERGARLVANLRQEKSRQENLQKSSRLKLEDLFSKIKEGEVKVLNIILKADVHGSVEAVRESLERLGNDEVKVKVIHGGIGAISETDVMLASASNAIIIGFNVRPDTNAKKIAERENVDIRLYRVIYNAIDDVKAALAGMLEPEFKEVTLGRAEVRATFRVPKAGTVAGCYVTEGKILRSADVRILRDNVVIHEGKIESLKRFKDDAREVVQGYECGIGIENFNDIKEGDVIEAFQMEAVKRQI
ncbi:MAG: translation initiation factor IF-2 [Syntrophothermus sp.]